MTSGERLGGQIAKGDGLTIPPHSYRAIATIAVQPKRATPLLNDEAIAGGLAARFLWFNFEDATAATLPRPRQPTTPTVIPLQQWEGVHYIDALPEMDTAHETDARTALAGTREPIDSRTQLNRAITATALANLDGRATLTPEDWHLAGAITAHSQHTLEHVRDTLAEPDETREPAITTRMLARMNELRSEGVPFEDARRRPSRPQGNILTALIHDGNTCPGDQTVLPYHYQKGLTGGPEAVVSSRRRQRLNTVSTPSTQDDRRCGSQVAAPTPISNREKA